MARRYHVFIVGTGPRRAVELPEDAIDFSEFVDAVQAKVGLRAADLIGIVFRCVDVEPDEDNAGTLFDACALRKVNNNASLSAEGVRYVVGKLAESE